MDGLLRRRYHAAVQAGGCWAGPGREAISSVAKTLGISGQSLQNCMKAEAAGKLREVQGKSICAEQMEIARLKAELIKTRMERDILKNRRGRRPPVGEKLLRAILAAEGSGGPLIGGE